MKKKLKIKITSDDITSPYTSVHDCPLCKAIKKEHKAESVIIWGSSVGKAVIDGKTYSVSNWSHQIYLSLKSKLLDEIVVTLELRT